MLLAMQPGFSTGLEPLPGSEKTFPPVLPTLSTKSDVEERNVELFSRNRSLFTFSIFQIEFM
jgi:hypothetical protein